MITEAIINSNDIIAAISTPVGEGGIGIIRMSGKGSAKIAKKLFKPYKKENESLTHYLIYGHIVDDCDHPIDEVLVSFMKPPRTYTREEMVEINCHSGLVVLQVILEMLIKNGARLAEPGEFTRRAYENGRISLEQAESILNVIRAGSERVLKASVQQIKGRFGEKIKNVREIIWRVLAIIEAQADFPGDAAEGNMNNSISKEVAAAYKMLIQIKREGERGKVFQEGIKVVIIGRPNVGKSSIMNALLEEDRAIVTEIPGTTRDIIRETMITGGINVDIYDTAGLREPQDMVERIGVEKAQSTLMKADIILMVLDAAAEISDEDWTVIKKAEEADGKILVVINKGDLENKLCPAVTEKRLNIKTLVISAKNKTGIEDLRESIKELAEKGIDSNESIMIMNMRHFAALDEAIGCMKNAQEQINSIPADIISIDLKMADTQLGMITGEDVGEEVLDRIFSMFCIGK